MRLGRGVWRGSRLLVLGIGVLGHLEGLVSWSLVYFTLSSFGGTFLFPLAWIPWLFSSGTLL